MPYFEIQLTAKLQRIYDVGADTVIGRGPQCQIQLLSRAVSRKHARVEFGDSNEAIISDLGTKNGIKLNGKRVQGAAVISEGDTLLVGDVSMVFRAADRTAPAPQDMIDLRARPATPDDARAALEPRSAFLLRADEALLAHFQNTVGRARIAALDQDDTAKFKLQIALKEALDNARIHGSGGDRNRTIQVVFGDDQDEFVMSVRDEGAGYDVEQRVAASEEIDALEAIRNRPALGSGLGLRIILNCVDRLQFEGRGATIHMGKFKEGGQIIVISDESDQGPTGPGPAGSRPPQIESDELGFDQPGGEP